MRSVWHFIASLLAASAAIALADSRHDALDPSKHPPEHFYVNGKRPPGSLILTMLTKDEAENLDKTLPKWAKVIDYWVIGIDDANTDNSPEVIMKHVGHIPGEIVTVHFDGMGPTWTKLTDKGWELFPEGTHGIVADADYVPTDRMIANFNKHDLHIGANKLLYKLWNDPNAVSDVRKMDWIYRNMPGVKVTRRVHQTVNVPPFYGSNSIRVEEAHSIDILELGGGYQLRTMSSRGRNMRYIKLLEMDLADIPNDPRTLYYLADSHRGVFMAGYNENNVTESDWEHLRTAIKYYKQRLAVPHTRNNFEETYFTMIAIAELSERFLRDYDEGFKYYQKAFDFDPERADPLFYIGQRKRLNGQPEAAIEPLLKAARMQPAVRSVFQWVAMYDCIASVELARAVHSQLTADGYSDILTFDIVKETLSLLGSKANSDKGCEFHRESDYARDGFRLASALADFVRQGPPAADAVKSSSKKNAKGAKAARKKYSKPGAKNPSRASTAQQDDVAMSPVVNTERPRGGRYFDSDKYGPLTRFEPHGGGWAFQYPMAEADMGLGHSTARKRELGVPGSDKARMTASEFRQQMSLVDEAGKSFTVGTAQWNHGVHKRKHESSSMPSAADRARTGSRRLPETSRALLGRLASTLHGWLNNDQDASVLKDTVATHPAPPQTFLPTSPLSPQYNSRSDNRGVDVSGTAAEAGYEGEGALMVYKPGEAPTGNSKSSSQASIKKRKRRKGGPKSAKGGGDAHTFSKVRNPLAPKQDEPMRDFLRRTLPGGVVPGGTRVRSQASTARHNPMPAAEVRSFWDNEFKNVALSALDRTATRARFLKEVVDSPARAVTCADFRQQIRLLQSMLSSGGFDAALPQLTDADKLQAELAAAREDTCYAISA